MTNQPEWPRLIDELISRFKQTFPNIYLNYYGNHAEESIEMWLRKDLLTEGKDSNDKT